MKPYRYSLAVTSQFFFCGIPFRLDTTPKCSLNCLYCFAMSRGGRRTPTNLIADPQKIRKKFTRATQQEFAHLDIVGSFLKESIPLHFGGMSDPFSNLVAISKSRELLNVLAEFDYPTVLSTKNSSELCREDTLNLLKEHKHLIVQVSISSNDEIAKIVEPHVPSTQERLDTLRLLNEEGIYTIVRIQPLFPADINTVVSEVIPQIGEAGVHHVVVEFLKLPIEKEISKVSELFNQTGWDGLKFYQNVGALRIGREWVLRPEYKWELMQPIIKEIHRHGMTFGAGDYGLNHLSDTDCCCGIDVVEGFSHFFKPNFPYIIKKSKGSFLIFDEVSNFIIPDKSIRMYLNSHCREDHATTILDYLRWKWNRPGTENAPDTFMGVKWAGEYDVEGNCVYRIDNWDVK